MPKTIIQLQTFMCSQCRFHRSSDNMTEDGLCPIHKLPLEKTTAPEDKITVTIMDEAEVETAQKEDTTQPKDAEGKFPQRPLIQSEKDDLLAKISADTEKFSLLEDK